MGAIAAPTRGFVLVMLTPYLHFCLKPKFVFSLEEIRMRLMYLGNRLIQPGRRDGGCAGAVLRVLGRAGA